MRIGYLRVSTEEQRPDRQIDGMKALCDELHVEKVSACAPCRPVFDDVLSRLAAGDTLIVWDLDRAFRSTRDALNTLDALKAREVEFRIVNLGVDTTTADGMLVFTMIAALAEHERKRLSERTKQGLAAARRRGKTLGRKPKLTDADVQRAIDKFDQGTASVAEIAARHGVHPSTLRRRMEAMRKRAADIKKD